MNKIKSNSYYIILKIINIYINIYILMYLKRRYCVMLNKLILFFILYSAFMASPGLAQEVKQSCVKNPHWGFPASKIARPLTGANQCEKITLPQEKIDTVQTNSISIVRRVVEFYFPAKQTGMPLNKIARKESIFSVLRSIQSGQAYSGIPTHKQARK
jgi:hypothetical protein